MTTKKSKFNPYNKLPLWAAIWGVLLIAGAVLAIVFTVLDGYSVFSPTAKIADTKALVVSYDAFIQIDDTYEDELKTICVQAIENENLEIVETEITDDGYGGSFVFKFSPSVSDETLETVAANIQTAAEGSATLAENGTIYTSLDYQIENNEVQFATDYIWRAALAGGVLLLIAFLYIFIRYSLSMGLAALISGIADVGVMLSLIIIARVPVTTTLAVMAVFAVLYSVLLSLLSFSEMRKVFKSEEYQEKSVDESMPVAAKGGMLPMLLVDACVLVVCVFLAIFGGEIVRATALAAIIAVVATTFSAFCAKPALVAAFMKTGRKIKANRLAKRAAARKAAEAMNE